MASPEDCIPEDKLPPCWADDVRMNALFAPFRLKSANPESWQMKMKFWSDMLRQWCRHRSDPIISASDAKMAFMRKGRTPACIDIVIEELLRNSELSPISKYTTLLSTGPEGWIHWTARLAIKPVSVAASAFTSLIPSRYSTDSDGAPRASILPTQRFVLDSAVKEQATSLLRHYPQDLERFGTIEELMKNVGYLPNRRESLEILLGYLMHQGMAVNKGDLFKIAETTTKVSPITEAEEALHRLLTAEKKLQADADKYHRDADRALEDARVASTIGNKIAAKHHLRRKHKCLDRASGCDTALENVRQLLHNVKQMELNTTVVNTYKMSTDAMKKTMKDGGLTEEAAHETMDDLKEVLEEYNEVEKALGGPAEDYDVTGLEEELAELLAGGGTGGGGNEKEQKTPRKEPNSKSPNMPTPGSERDFVFDGEARMIAELNDLSVEDRSPKETHVRLKQKVGESTWVINNNEAPQTDEDGERIWSSPEESTDSKYWQGSDDNYNYEDNLCDSNLSTSDCRLHPGQPVPPEALYTSLHSRPQDDHNQYGDAVSPSPTNHPPAFLMAPGEERKKNTPEDSMATLERRLKTLRGNDA